jgi:hypothetical protein
LEDTLLLMEMKKLLECLFYKKEIILLLSQEEVTLIEDPILHNTLFKLNVQEKIFIQGH